MSDKRFLCDVSATLRQQDKKQMADLRAKTGAESEENMTDRYFEKARDIMDNACLPPALASVSEALQQTIAQALRDERWDALEAAAGMVLVPMEPTSDMMGAASLASPSEDRGYTADEQRAIYRAMIAAFKKEDGNAK